LKKLLARWTPAVTGVTVLALATAAFAGPPTTVPTVRLTATTEIAAKPTAVWDYMTSGATLVTWCPYWKSPDNKNVDLDAVGAVLEFTDDWGGGGRSIVTYLDPGKELRVAHEPNDGSYMCQSKLVLTPGESGTKVVYDEQYTDDQDAKNREATAAKMQTSMEETLATLKSGVEGS